MKYTDRILTTAANTFDEVSDRALLLAENYCRRKFVITTNSVRLRIETGDDRLIEYYTHQSPITYSGVTDENDTPVANSDHTDSYVYNTELWPTGVLQIAYTAGYTHLPDDLDYAIKELERILDERTTQVADSTGTSGDLGSLSLVSGISKLAIPMELRGIFNQYRRAGL